jgi:histidyl-tRNA synthetase
MRRAGLAAELVATGSPRKRFDRAKKLNPAALVSLDVRDGNNWKSFRATQDGSLTAAKAGEVYNAFFAMLR